MQMLVFRTTFQLRLDSTNNIFDVVLHRLYFQSKLLTRQFRVVWRFNVSQHGTAKKLSAMKEQITESFRALEAEKKIREQLVAEKDKELASIDARLHRALEAEQQMRREAEVAASFSIIEFYSLACCLKNRRPTGLPHELMREKLAITQGT